MGTLVDEGEGGVAMPRVLRAPPKGVAVMLIAATAYALALVLALYCSRLLVDFFIWR